MKTISRITLLFLLAACVALAQPSITAVQNAASNLPPGLPGANIAQGSMFVVYGKNLGPSSYIIASSFPLPTTAGIGGTTVKIQMGGITYNGIMYYSGPTQVATILPSTVPTGTGTVTVTYNGQSATSPITVVSNSLGIYTLSQSGSGDAIATLGYTFVAPGNSPNPGETVGFWGTGLGPVTGDETQAAPISQQDLNVPVEAYVGGKSAVVQVRGRNNCCSSVDVVYIKIPDGVTGCAVPVAFKIGNVVSNTTTIPVATSGRTCTPTSSTVSTTDISTWINQGSYSFGSVSLSRSVTTTQPIVVGGISVGGGTTRGDAGSATFEKVTVPAGGIGLGSAFDIASYGSCTVAYYSGQSGSAPSTYTYKTLDAGSAIGVSGPNGSQSLPKNTSLGYIFYTKAFDSTGTYLSAGSYGITGPGGPDVGSFSTTLAVPTPLVWTNQSSITSVTRANGVTVNWTGGDPKGFVQISGISTTGDNYVAGYFLCTAKTSDGTFTVPPMVLLGLPPTGTLSSGGVSIPLPGTLAVTGVTAQSTFKASGLDYGFATSTVSNSTQVTYK